MIELSAVHKHYQTGDTVVSALDGVDISIPAGQFVSIMGRSGSGKSTLLNILGCMDRPTSGQYRLAGQEIELLDDDSLSDLRCRQIGFVFQSFHLLPRLSATENVMLPLRYRGDDGDGRERALALLDQVGLADRADHRPNQLSGGQRQRVAIARALINQPGVLLADEPTGNLDSSTSEDILGLLETLNTQGQTVVMVTHEPEISRRADRVIVLSDGQVAA